MATHSKVLASSVVRKQVLGTFQKVGRIVLIQKHLRTVLVFYKQKRYKAVECPCGGK